MPKETQRMPEPAMHATVGDLSNLSLSDSSDLSIGSVLDVDVDILNRVIMIKKASEGKVFFFFFFFFIYCEID
jgi:hypothetical protein